MSTSGKDSQNSVYKCMLCVDTDTVGKITKMKTISVGHISRYNARRHIQVCYIKNSISDNLY